MNKKTRIAFVIILTIGAVAGWVAVCQDFFIHSYFFIISRGSWIFEAADGHVVNGTDDMEHTEIKEFLLTRPTGKMTRTTKSGVAIENCSLVNGNKDGVLRRYDRSGVRLIDEMNYTNGILHGEQRSWWKNGRLMFYENYRDGHEDGIFTNWYESGNTSFIRSYTNGVLHGESFDYAPGGRLVAHCVVSNWATLNGTELLSNDGKGNVRLALFKDGVFIKEWTERE
jgi:antitoxin component YwqK of YwqJK toxin-antitoxin module